MYGVIIILPEIAGFFNPKIWEIVMNWLGICLPEINIQIFFRLKIEILTIKKFVVCFLDYKKFQTECTFSKNITYIQKSISF